MRTMNRLTVAAGAAAAATALIGTGSPARAATATSYRLIISPAQVTQYLSVNTRGDILGSGTEPGAQTEEPFILNAGAATLGWLAAPGDPGNTQSTTVGNGLNDAGQAVGFRFPTGQVVGGMIDENDRPLRWKGGGTTGTDLGVDLGLAEDVHANAINDNGQIVGSSAVGDRTTPWELNGGALTRLPVLSGHNAEPLAINGSGDSVGHATLSNGDEVAVRWHGGKISSLGALPGGGFSVAVSVDAAGDAVGSSSTTAGVFGPEHAVLFSHGTVTNLHVRGDGDGNSASANAINDNGVIVGEDAAQHAFVYQNGQAADLNTLIPAGSGFTLVAANGINDSGVIVGTAVQGPSGVQAPTVGFELVPNP